MKVKNILKINNLKISSSENNLVLVDNATLDISSGEIVLLEGANGSGKSTILNAIMHNPNYKIEEGQIFINDTDVTELEAHELAKMGMYISMQHSPEIEGVSTIKMLYKAYKFVNQNKTEEDNLNNQEKNTKSIIGKKELSITEFKKELEIKCELFALDTSLLMRDVNVGFSGGQKKQADLMHMLALDPKFILMDEPDSGVDREAVSKVYAVINHFKEKGAAILITSHNEKIKDLDISKIYKIQDRVVTQIN